MIQTSPPTRMLRIRHVTDTSGLSRASIYRLMKLGLFPKSIKIGISAVGWCQAEIELWKSERKNETLH
ncbi:MAG: helix-turn-helix transcriptional regulator [Gallionella sp.]